MDTDIGERVRSAISELPSARSHRDIAQSVKMKPDAFSRSLNGERSFSSIEIARIADELNQDVHWLITGEDDPMRPRVAARHFYDHDSRNHYVPGREDDEAVLADITLAYKQAYPDDVPYSLCELPSRVDEVREWLGPAFVRPFIDRVEANLLVEIVRIEEITTSYTLCVGSHTAIVIPASGSWFRENWSIAHELGHIAARDLDISLPTTRRYEHETAANAFAVELLLPAEEVRQVDWAALTADDLARRVWDFGVSVQALQHRLATLRLPSSDVVAAWATAGTPSLLRFANVDLDGTGPDASDHAVAKRTRDASGRRFPYSLQEAHMKRIAMGELGKETLAWMLGVKPDLLEEVDGPPEPPSVGVDELAALLEL